MAKDTFERKDIFVTTKIFHFPKDIALQSLGNTLDWADDSINLTERTLYDFERCLDELNLGTCGEMDAH